MVYTAAKGSRLSDEQAQRYGEHFEMLNEEWDGELTANVVLSDAEHPESPTHEFFVWDDSDAAQRYRLTQARYLLRSIHVVVKTPQDEVVETRAWVRVTIETEAGDSDNGAGEREYHSAYVQIKDAMSSASLRAQVIGDALGQLNSWRERYKQYTELQQVFHAIDTVQERLALVEAA